jgi:hypothetical protein
LLYEHLKYRFPPSVKYPEYSWFDEQIASNISLEDVVNWIAKDVGWDFEITKKKLIFSILEHMITINNRSTKKPFSIKQERCNNSSNEGERQQ